MKTLILISLFITSSTLMSKERPTLAFTVAKDTLCICNQGRSDSGKSCDLFCYDKKVEAGPVLYAMVIPSREIEQSKTVNTLNDWCTKEIDDGLKSPICVMRISHGSYTADYNLTLYEDINAFKAPIYSIKRGQTYRAIITEISSNARSKIFTFKRD